MQDKEALVRAHAFLPLPIFYGIEYESHQGIAYLLITKEVVGKALLYQSIIKLPGPNMHKFRTIYLL